MTPRRRAPLPPAAATGPGVFIDKRLVRIEALGQRAAPALGELGVTPDDLDMAGIILTRPDRERRAPVAVPRQGPVDVVFQPFTETPCAHLRRMPVNLSIEIKHTILHRRRAHEPGIARVIDQWTGATPAVRILVGIRFGGMPAPVLLQPLDNEVIGFS